MNDSESIRRVERLVVAGTMGPTLHDVHAWRFRTAHGQIELHADPARFRTSHSGPADGAAADAAGGAGSKYLYLTCGAVLLNLRLAAAQLAHEAVVRLLPDGSRPMLLATARLTGHRKVARQERLLYAATLRPLPSARSSAARAGSAADPAAHAAAAEVPAAVLTELQEAARLEGAALRLLAPEQGPVEDRTAPHGPEQASGHGSEPGSEPGAVGDRTAPRHDRFGGRQALLTVGGDSPAAWLRAGQALQRILLAAAVRDVAVGFRYVEAAGMTGPVLDVLQQGDVPHAVVTITGTSDRRMGPAGPLPGARSLAREGAEHGQVEGEPHLRPVG